MNRALTAVRVPTDPSVVARLLPALEAALEGSGPAVLPVPEDGSAVGPDLVAALRPDDEQAPLEADGVAAVVATSGSTGRPKGVLLSRTGMTWAADALHRLVGGPGTWLLALPAWHIGGLQVITRSLRAGTTPVAMDLRASFTARAFVRSTHDLRDRAGRSPTYTSLVPTQLGRLLDGGPAAVEALASYDAVLVGSAATPVELSRRAAVAGCRLLLSYGMSETSGGCCYDGRPLDGVELRLREGDDRVLVRGPTVFIGYRLRPDLTADALVDGWLVTQDVGRRGPDGAVEVLGRADDMLVTGGEKVSPLAVAEVLRAHGSVVDAAVVGLPDAEWGQAVVAYVQPTAPLAGLDPGDLREHVRAALGRAAVPRRIVVVDSLPLLPSGKVDRAALVAARTDEADRAEDRG